MILEVAILNIKDNLNSQFELSFKQAEKIISSIKGYKSHQLKKCVEKNNKYILLVYWESIEDHEIGFRKSESYKDWKKLLHHFYDPFPIVEHYHDV